MSAIMFRRRAFEPAVRQIPTRRWLRLTATPYRRDRLDDLIALQIGPARHIISHHAESSRGAPGHAAELPYLDTASGTPVSRLARVLHVHPTRYRYAGDADPSAPGGMAAIYQDLAADDTRTSQATVDVAGALARGRNCLVLTKWITHLDRLVEALREKGFDPVVLRCGMGARARAAAIARLKLQADGGAAAGGRYWTFHRGRLRFHDDVVRL
jgi:superfamily II DNA or RNA helicase